MSSINYTSVRYNGQVCFAPFESLTTAEALIGQLYPAILIATLAGMALQARFNSAVKETEVEKSS